MKRAVTIRYSLAIALALVMSTFLAAPAPLLAQEIGQIAGPNGWTWQNLSRDLNGVWGSAARDSAGNANDVYAVGGFGTILHYDGPSATGWAWQSSGTTSDLYAVWGSNFAAGTGFANDVYAVGAAGAIVHYDGTAWSSMTSGTTKDLYAVWGSSPSDVYAVGAGGTILHYSGFGDTWAPVTGTGTADLRGVWGSSSTDVWAVGANGTILHNNGSGWTQATAGNTKDLYAIWGSAAADIYAVGARGTILHFDGSQWTGVSGNYPAKWESMPDVYALWGNSSTAVTGLGADSSYFSCTSYVCTGSVIAVPEVGGDVDLHGIWGGSATDIFAVGPLGTVIHYSSSGWSTMLRALPYSFSAVSGVQWPWGESAVWATGSGTAVLRTTDPSTLDGFECEDRGYLRAIWVPSTVEDAQAWAVGDNGRIEALAGLQCRRDATSSGVTLAGVWGASAFDAFAVGTQIYHFDDGIWSLQPASYQYQLNSVWGSSSTDVAGLANDVFAVGASGEILHYTGSAGSGSSWQPMTSNTTNDLYGVWGSALVGSDGRAKDVYAVGANGTIVHYDGSVWATVSSGTTKDLYGIGGSAASDIYAVGAAGTILHYDGTSWLPMTIGALFDLTGVWVTPSGSDVFAVGGPILHYSPQTSPTPTPAVSSIAPNSAAYGSAAFTLTIDGSNFVSSSLVRFAGSQLPTAVVSSTQLLATVHTTDLAQVGTYDVTVVSGGGEPSNALTFTVTSAATALSVAANPSAILYGGDLSLTATMSPAVANETIVFSLDGNGEIARATTNRNGVAAWSGPLSSSINAGTHSLVATFTGDTTCCDGVAAASTLTINQQPVSITLNRGFGYVDASYGGTVDLVADGIPGIQLGFMLGSTYVGSATTDSRGTATLAGVSVRSLEPGFYTSYVSVTFSGTQNYAPASATGNLIVTPASTRIAAVSATYPYFQGEAVTLTAVVTSTPGLTVNDGTVQFMVGSSPNILLSGVGNVTNGVVTVTVHGFSFYPLGCASARTTGCQFMITASYEGSTHFAASSDNTHNLTLVQNTSQVAVSNFTIAPQLVALPELLGKTGIARVTNHGPDPALGVYLVCGWVGSDGTRHPWWPGSYSTVALAPGESTTLPCSTYFDTRTPADSTIYAFARTDSFVPDPSPNYQSVVLNGIYGTTSAAQGAFRVNVNGYSFANRGGSPDWSLYEDTFGADNVDPGFSLSGVINLLTADVPSAVFYKAVYEPTLSGGNCYGMSVTSLRYFNGQDSPSKFGNWGSVNQIRTDYSESNPVWRNIEKFSGYQLGGAQLSYFASSSWSAVKAVHDLEKAMDGVGRNGNGKLGMLLLLKALPPSGHVVVPYWIEETTDAAGHWAYVYVYDNNSPDATLTVIPVDMDHDTFNWNGYSSGGGNGLLYMSLSDNDDQPSLVFGQLATMIVGGVLVSMPALAAVSGPADLLTTDSSGNSLGYQNGALVESIPNARLVRPLDDSDSAGTLPQLYVMPPGQYSRTMSGNATAAGPAAMSVFETASTLVFVSNNMTPATRDTITYGQDGRSAVLTTNVTNESYGTTLYTALNSSVFRDYALSNTSMAAGEQISLTVLGDGSFQMSNQGASKSYDLTLKQAGIGPSAILFSGVNIGANETHIVTPSDWANLRSAPVNMRIQNNEGTTSGMLQAAAITSAGATSFVCGTPGVFTVTVAGFPKPVLIESGALPAGVTFDSTTGVLSGRPATDTVGTYNITLEARNGVGNSAIQNFTLAVSAAATATTVTSSAMPAVTGQSVTLSATVTAVPPGVGTPTGTVKFADGTTILGIVSLASGQASFATPALAVGTHSITVEYSGDANFIASRAMLSQQVAYNICTLYDQTKAVQRGATVPIKLYLCNSGGTDASSPSIMLHATEVVGVSGFSGDPESPGNSTSDDDFVFDRSLGPAGGYHFNLKTTGLASGRYSLWFTVSNDPIMHSVNFGVR